MLKNDNIRGSHIWKKKHLNLQSVKARISAFFTSRKMWHMFKVNNKDTIIRKGNDKVKNKDIAEVVPVSLVLTLNTFNFCCWLWSVNCRLGLVFVVLMLCASWNQFRQSFHLWRNYVKRRRVTFLVNLIFRRLDKFDGPISGKRGGIYTAGRTFEIFILLHIWWTYIRGRERINGILLYFWEQIF